MRLALGASMITVGWFVMLHALARNEIDTPQFILGVATLVFGMVTVGG